MTSAARAVAVYAIPLPVAAITLRSLVKPGYLIQIDSAFGPVAPPVRLSFTAPIDLLVRLLQLAGGGQWAGRLYVFVALSLCGVGAVAVLRGLPWWARTAGGILAMLNPYVYERLVEGQWGVVAATGGTFLFVASWLRMRRRPGPTSSVLVAACVVLVVASSANFIVVLLLLTAALAFAASDWSKPAYRNWALASLLLSAAACSYGIVGFFFGHGYSTLQNVSHFTATDFRTFQSNPDPHYGLIPALVGLYGEWGERAGRYPVVDALFPWWIVSAGVLCVLAIAGAWLRPAMGWLLVLGAAGIALSASTAVPAVQRLAIGVADRFPLLGAYREPEKSLVLWLLALVLLAATATVALGDRLRVRRIVPGRAAGPLLAAILVAAALAPGGWAELRNASDLVTPVNYPRSWYSAAAYLRSNVPAGAPVAVLPWHLYEVLPFIGRETVDPATVFFPGTLVSSNDPELPGEPPNSAIGVGAQRGPGCSLAAALRAAGVSRALVIEGAPGGQAGDDALRSCGFVSVFSSQGEIDVLARPH